MTKPFFLLVFVAVLAAGCNAKVATVLASDDGGVGGSSQAPDGSVSTVDSGTVTTKDCAAIGGTCFPEGTVPDDNWFPSQGGTCDGTDVCFVRPPAKGTVPACYRDQDCNEDPSVSSLQGSCFYGICLCHPPLVVQPSGRCGAAPAPDCGGQGGVCTNGADCPSGELSGELETNMSCGDKTPAVCCTPKSECNGPAQEAAGAGWIPVDMVCCGASTTPYEPNCVNGWQTCDGRGVPALRKDGC